MLAVFKYQYWDANILFTYKYIIHEFCSLNIHGQLVTSFSSTAFEMNKIK